MIRSAAMSRRQDAVVEWCAASECVEAKASMSCRWSRKM